MKACCRNPKAFTSRWLRALTTLFAIGGALGQSGLASPTQGLVAYWPLDVVNGMTTPDVINGYNMTLVNMTSNNLVTGRWGKAMSFTNAAHTMLQRTNSAGNWLPVYNTTNGWAVSLWVKAAAGQWGNVIFSEANSGNSSPIFNLETGTRGAYDKGDVFIRDSSGANLSSDGSGNSLVETTVTVYDNTWHHA